MAGERECALSGHGQVEQPSFGRLLVLDADPSSVPCGKAACHAALDNIVGVLGCTSADIRDVYPLKQGLTNSSYHFRVGDGEYVYRHPGIGTDELINRACETQAQVWAQHLGLDHTFVHEDEHEGWKISLFIPNCRELDPHNARELEMAARLARRLHESGASVDASFDFYEEALRYRGLLEDDVLPAGFEEELAQITALHQAFQEDGLGKRCLCHNDFFSLNMLVDRDDTLSLIDWEYAGMADYAQDLGTSCVCCELSSDETEALMTAYFGTCPTRGQRGHVYACVAFAGWCWYVWSIYKEACGGHVGPWLDVYHRYAQEYAKRAGELYGL